MNRDILKLAIPNIISNITIPLLSIVDMAIVGHLDSEKYIGAIVISTTIFNFIYWNFSFLRMGTSGFTAQAYGAEDRKNQVNVLVRALTIAFVAALLILVFQSFILKGGLYLLDAKTEVREYASQYFSVYIWAAPAVLGIYVFNGWFVGMQDAKTPMFIAIAINIINISLSFFFVYVLKMKIGGVALATTCAQYAGFVAIIVSCRLKYKNLIPFIDLTILKDFKSFKFFAKVNNDIFIRTFALICVTTFFVSVSTRMGDNVLAANAILMQLFTLFSYFMDGFAYAAEALTGKLIGASKTHLLKKLFRYLFSWGVCLALVCTVIYFFLHDQVLYVMTDKVAIISLAKQFHIWVLLIPLCSFSAFLWDGIFIGATASKQMRNSMLIAVALFFTIYAVSRFLGDFNNQILWLMFVVYLTMRGVIQWFMSKKIFGKVEM